MEYKYSVLLANVFFNAVSRKSVAACLQCLPLNLLFAQTICFYGSSLVSYCMHSPLLKASGPSG